MSAETLDTVTLLTARGATLAKRWRRDAHGAWHATPAGMPRLFDVDRREVCGARDLAAVLRDLSGDPTRCAIRGELREGRATRGVRRTCTGPVATFAPAARRWVALDLDGIPMAPGADPIDPDDGVDAALGVLPEEFDGVAVAWQLTGSHGIKEGARVRLWYWLSRPVADRELKTWLAGVPGLDPVLFNAVQVHYTAAPIVEGGDPLPMRCGFRDGAECVEVPEIRRPNRRVTIPGDTRIPGGADFSECLDRIGRGAGKDGFHRAMLAAARAAYREQPHGDPAAVAAAIRARAEAELAAAGEDRPGLHDEVRRLAEWARAEAAERLPPMPERIAAPDARRELTAHMHEFFDAARDYHDDLQKLNEETKDREASQDSDPLDFNPPRPPRYLIEASLGLGKTEAAIAASVARIRALRAEDNRRVAVYAVPTHKLGDELAARIGRVAGGDLTVTVLRGREATDTDGTPMCRNLDFVREALAVLAPSGRVCRECPLESGCRHVGQSRTADIIVVTHQRLLSAMPAEIERAGVDHLVIDENPIGALLYGVDGPPVELPVDALFALRSSAGADRVQPDLVDARHRLIRACDSAGPLRAERLREVGLSAQVARMAAGLEWARKIEIDDRRPLRAQIETLKPNRTIPRLSRLWHEIGRLLEEGGAASGRLSVVSGKDTERVIRISGLHAIRRGWAEAPTILLDATPEPQLLRQVFGPLEHHAVHADEPHATLRQCAGKSFAKTMLHDSPSERGRIACRNNRARLARLVREKARDGDVLLVSNKSVIEKLRDEHALPEAVSVAWFNALRGLDCFGSVRYVIVAGRPQPSPEALVRIAGAVTGAVEHEDGETARAVLRSIREAEIEQAVGRGRGVNRTAETPLDVLVLGDVWLRRPVRFVPLAEVWRNPSPAERMAEAGGIVFASPAHAAAAYPDLWASKQAAAKVWPASGQLSSLDIPPNDKSCPVEIRRPRSREVALAWVDRTQHPDPRAAIEALLGPLSHCEVLGGAAEHPPEHPPEPEPPAAETVWVVPPDGAAPQAFYGADGVAFGVWLLGDGAAPIAHFRGREVPPPPHGVPPGRALAQYLARRFNEVGRQ